MIRTIYIIQYYSYLSVGVLNHRRNPLEQSTNFTRTNYTTNERDCVTTVVYWFTLKPLTS